MEKKLIKERMEGWRIQSSDEPGFHEVIIPGRNDCKSVYVYRLNLLAGERFTLSSGTLEMNPVLIGGAAILSGEPFENCHMKQFDSFYIPANMSVNIESEQDCIFYIGAAKFEGIGVASFREFVADLPLGDVHQIHGSGAGQREVMFTLTSNTPASSLICGITWGGDGSWTGWPPHQHEKDLEEVYCYFDMPAPNFGFHVSYLESGGVNDAVAHVVQSGTMVVCPQGYHPTVASPGTKNTYLWVLAAFSNKSRRYDLAITDPNYIET